MSIRALQRSIAVRRVTRTQNSLHRTVLRHILFAHPLSSVPPPTEKLNQSESLDPPLPNAPANRKPKVDLRPGPVKSADSNRTPSPASKSQKDSRVTPDAPSQSSAPPSGPINASTKRGDFEDAAKHGILTPPPPGASRLRQIIHQAKELIKFYWRGLNMINANRKRVRDIKKRIREGGSPISRWESRFIKTYKEDALKLVPFVVVVIVLEEIIPLIAIYAPFMLPSTCVLPSQRDRIEIAKKTRQISYADNNRSLFRKLSDGQSGYVPLAALNSNVALSHAMCGLLRLSTFGFNGMRIRRIRRHMEYIAKDDELLAQEDMGASLSPSELAEALQERGIITERDHAARLKWWLTSVNEPDRNSPVTRRLYVIAKNASKG